MNIYLQTLRKQDPDYYLPDKRDQTVELVLNALYIRINKCTTILKDESYSKYCDCICPLLDSVSKKCMTLEVCQAACVQSSGNWRFLPCPSKLFPDMKSSAVDAIYAQFYDKWDFHKFLSFESTLPLSDNEKKVIDAYIHMANLCFEQEKRESQIRVAMRKIREMKQNDRELDRYTAYWNGLANKISTCSYPITKYPNINLCPIILETAENHNIEILHSSDTTYNMILPAADAQCVPVYYISDMHLECQFDLENKTLFEIKNALKYKADELSRTMIYGNGLICIAGDTSNSSWLFALFMEELYKACHYSNIISILGNHELLDLDEELSDINEIRDKYANMSNICVLQNGLRVKYQGQKERILHDYNILEYSDEKLSEICRNSTQIVLGGTGFSGYEPVYNTSRVAWGNAVTTPEQEKIESDKFKEIYNKILRCAADQTVIVLTHTPMRQWFGKGYTYNPNWIYINGHTHRNEIIREKNGITVLSDNQVGYKPSKFSFKCIPIKGWYDPFENWDDGIYQITKEQYEIFNRGRGIYFSFDRQGYQIYMVKRNTIYMFFAKGKSLCMLSGGRITKVEHDLTYYFNNLYAYQTIISKMFESYNAALTIISSGIKQLGGIGTIHGCIVDIDFYNHIYLNPFDGQLTFYYATDMVNKTVFPDLKSLLKEIENEELYKGYIQHEKDNLCPVLYSKQHKNQSLAVQNPELVLDTSMYEPSNVMRGIQYIFDQNVIRVWNDKILEQKENLLTTGVGSDDDNIYIDC